MSIRRAIFILCAAVAAAQQPPQPSAPTEFEIASVRLSPGGITNINPAGSPGFTASNISMEILVSLAYGVNSDMVSGPAWISSQQYNVAGKVAGDRRLTYQELQAPLQKLLEERFRIAVHHVTKEANGFALVAAKSGPKLHETKGEPFHAFILKDGVDLQNGTLDMLAGVLRSPSGRPVVNQTGIKGNFDIRLHYAPSNAPNSNLPSLFTALSEQIGLQLISKKVPADAIIIDHVDRNPTEN